MSKVLDRTVDRQDKKDQSLLGTSGKIALRLNLASTFPEGIVFRVPLPVMVITLKFCELLSESAAVTSASLCSTCMRVVTERSTQYSLSGRSSENTWNESKKGNL